jgi:hypothetical protein
MFSQLGANTYLLELWGKPQDCLVTGITKRALKDTRKKHKGVLK